MSDLRPGDEVVLRVPVKAVAQEAHELWVEHGEGSYESYQRDMIEMNAIADILSGILLVYVGDSDSGDIALVERRGTVFRVPMTHVEKLEPTK